METETETETKNKIKSKKGRLVCAMRIGKWTAALIFVLVMVPGMLVAAT